jgi:hypothetical protein
VDYLEAIDRVAHSLTVFGTSWRWRTADWLNYEETLAIPVDFGPIFVKAIC